MDTKFTKEYSNELTNFSSFIDGDIIGFFNEQITIGSETQPRWYFTANSSAMMVNIQLVRVLKEAFSRGFIVKN